jgi:hypothetical protein
MNETEVIDGTELIQDIRTLLTLAVMAMDDDAEVIHINEELTATKQFVVKAALNLLDTMIGDEPSEPTVTLLSAVKAQMAIAAASGH